MAILLGKKNGKLAPTTNKVNAGPPLEVGRPLGISLLSFFPGTIKKDWGGKAEIMITSEIRFGPLSRAAPRRINMMLPGYDYKQADPVSDYGGDVYGDPMLYYTKAYAGQRVGLTLRGVELDKFKPSTWEGMDKVIENVGSLALFTAAAPYLGYFGLAKNVAKILVKALSRNDRLQTSRADLYFDDLNKKILQSGRYLIWEVGRGAGISTLRKHFKLTGAGADEPNRLVSIKDGTPFRATPYFVLQVGRKVRKDYEDFEIGAGSAKLLEYWGDKSLGETILDSVQQLAAQVNDAKQLTNIEDLLRDLKKAETPEEQDRIKAKIKAYAELFTKNNSALLSDLLASYLA